jgi:hypothetical protein
MGAEKYPFGGIENVFPSLRFFFSTDGATLFWLIGHGANIA